MNPMFNCETGEFDLAFVGLGLANSSTLIQMLQNLIDEPAERPQRIIMIERHAEPFTGVAYGPRSGSNALTISTLEDFVGADMRHEFIAWIRANETRLLAQFQRTAGDLSTQWVEKYKAATDLELETDICMPRSFFGEYFREKVTRLLATAARLGRVETTLLKADVSDIRRDGTGYKLTLTGHQRDYRAAKVLLGIGAPVASKLRHRSGEFANAADSVINDLYNTNVSALCAELADKLRRHPEGTPLNILTIGANASAIEFCYLLLDQPGLRSRVNKVFVMSPSGKFPERRCIPGEQPAFTPVALHALRERSWISAAEILEAMRADLATWRTLYPEGTVPVIAFNGEVVELVTKLDVSEKAVFAESIGVIIGKDQRRAGDEYLNLVDDMAGSATLHHVKGRFVQVASSSASGHQVEFIPAGSDQSEIFEHTVSVVVNGMGPRSLHERQTPLIDKLVEAGICKINDSGRGFKVDDNYEAAKNLIVTGPLIAGNVIRDMPVWHVEHCGRLATIGEVLGKELHASMMSMESAKSAAY